MREYERTKHDRDQMPISVPGEGVPAFADGSTDQRRSQGRTAGDAVVGGIFRPERRGRSPGPIVECGPAAGVIGAAQARHRRRLRDLISFDMGGQPPPRHVIENGRMLNSARIRVGAEISASSPLMKGGAMPLKLPVIDIPRSAPAAAASCGSTKAMVRSRSGPNSAGAVPVRLLCDGRRRSDRHGRQRHSGFPQPRGAVRPARCRSTRALAFVGHGRSPSRRRSLLETAYGIHQVANANMMRARSRGHDLRGRDPRDSRSTLSVQRRVHGVELARSLQIPRVIVPPAAASSAPSGLLTANVELTWRRGLLSRTARDGRRKSRADVHHAGRPDRRQLGYARDGVTFLRFADLRYFGPGLRAAVPGPIASSDARRSRELEGLFSSSTNAPRDMRSAGTFAMETVTAARHRLGDARQCAADRARQCELSTAGRRSYISVRRSASATHPSVRATRLAPNPRPGPLIVEEYEGTTVSASRLHRPPRQFGKHRNRRRPRAKRITCATTRSFPAGSAQERTRHSRRRNGAGADEDGLFGISARLDGLSTAVCDARARPLRRASPPRCISAASTTRCGALITTQAGNIFPDDVFISTIRTWRQASTCPTSNHQADLPRKHGSPPGPHRSAIIRIRRNRAGFECAFGRKPNLPGRHPHPDLKFMRARQADRCGLAD